MNEDTEWIRKARQGDRKAYRRLYDSHAPGLFRFLHQFTPNRTDVEEWVQRAFIKAFRELDAFDGQARFSSWLFRIGINEMKSDRRRPGTLHLMEAGTLPDTAAEEEFTWEATMRSLLAELSDAQKMVFILAEVEGYAHAEIAAMLGVTEGTSRSLLSRAKQHLRTLWLQEGERA